MIEKLSSMPVDNLQTRTRLRTVTEGNRTDLHAIVRETYGHAATVREQGIILSGCCSPDEQTTPAGTACGHPGGLGCGDPTALAALQSGESVLDLGSGAGFDCFAAAVCVGRHGRVIGIDLTPEMVRLAHRNAIAAGVPTVSFLLGEIERLPMRDEIFDVVMSNCVINLCPDKARVLTEAYRVLRRGGRLAVSDIVARAPLPAEIADDLALYAGCVAGAVTAAELSAALREAGFDSVRIGIGEERRTVIGAWAPGRGLERFVSAADITAVKS